MENIEMFSKKGKLPRGLRSPKWLHEGEQAHEALKGIYYDFEARPTGHGRASEHLNLDYRVKLKTYLNY